MQLNQGKFRENGNCGYLLRPEFMNAEEFDPYDRATLAGVDPLSVHLRVIGARHLSKSGRGTASPFVEVEVAGTDFDSGVKLTTKTICECRRLIVMGRRKNKRNATPQGLVS